MGAAALQRAITDHLRYSIGRPAAALGVLSPVYGTATAVHVILGVCSSHAASMSVVTTGVKIKCTTPNDESGQVDASSQALANGPFTLRAATADYLGTLSTQSLSVRR